MRKALSTAAGPMLGSTRAAKNVLTSRLRLISPSPSVTGSMSTKTRCTASSRGSQNQLRWPRRRIAGYGIANWTAVPSRIPMAYA